MALVVGQKWIIMRNIIWANFADHGMVTRGNITEWKNRIRRQQSKIRRLALQVKVLKLELQIAKDKNRSDG